MNFVRKIRKLQHNAKALSPVVASIILIAVTVAVSIAVAAWMGGLSTGFMQTEQATITNVVFSGTRTVTLTVANSGSTNITISTATVNGAAVTLTSGGNPLVLNTANNQIVLTLGSNWASGNTYQIRLVSSRGTSFPYSAVAQ
jgi:archaeal type IV pilus assembly protein PilA